MLKNGIIAIVLFLTASLSLAVDGSLNRYSQGYRLGVLSKCVKKKSPFDPTGLTKTFTCQLHMGRESSSTRVKGKAESAVSSDRSGYRNPWTFNASANDDIISKVEAQFSKPVVVEYNEYRNKFLAGVSPLRQTNYDMQDIYVIDPQLPSQASMEVPVRGFLTKSHGVRFGRIVKASEKGDLIDSFELIIQVGTGGSTFYTMSITQNQRALYDYAVEVLKSGKTAKIYYFQDSIELLNDTNFTIYKIELAEDPWKNFN